MNEPDSVPDHLVERLRRLDTCSIADALDRFHLRGATAGLRPLWPCPRIAGRAVTVKVIPEGPKRASVRLALPAIAAAQPGDVIVIDNGGRTEVSSWGDLLSAACIAKGVSGVVTDGASRDIDSSREMGFPVYGRATVAMTARGRVMQDSFNTTIQFAGVQVNPGDLVIADGSGVVFVPAESAEQVIEAAERMAKRQAAMIKEVLVGRPISEVMNDPQFRTEAEPAAR